MIKGAIFDMDGTMFDTEALSLEGWLCAAEKYHYPITKEVVDQIRGTNIMYSRALFAKLYGDTVDYDIARLTRTKYIEGYIEEHGVPVKEGLFELLEYLKQHHIKIAVATSTQKEAAEKYFKLANVYEYFDALVYGDMVTKGKPNPDIFQLAAKKLGLCEKECVVFEDSPNGIMAANAAGCKVIAIPDLTPIEGEILKFVDVCCKNLRTAMKQVFSE